MELELLAVTKSGASKGAKKKKKSISAAALQM